MYLSNCQHNLQVTCVKIKTLVALQAWKQNYVDGVRYAIVHSSKIGDTPVSLDGGLANWNIHSMLCTQMLKRT